MTPEIALKEGRLDEALQLLVQEVRSHPSDVRRRIFLFQLLALRGEWERSQTQLNVVGELDPVNSLMVTAYSALLRSEAARKAVFEGSQTPVIVGEPEAWVAMLLQALKLDAQGKHAEAAPLRAQALEQAETSAGTLDGKSFEWIADADPRFGPCLEVVLEGGYAWVPFSRIQLLKFDAPEDLRDKIWAPVQITWRNGGQAIGFVPTRYPGSEQFGDDDLTLARKTDWVAMTEDAYVGRGQRMLATDADEFSLLDVRSIEFAVS
jgi:type VI secretion system protein ImpE